MRTTCLALFNALKRILLIFCDQYKLDLSKYVGTWPTSAPACSSSLVIRKLAIQILRVLPNATATYS